MYKWLALIIYCIHPASLKADLDLEVLASGVRIAPPEWQNASSIKISSIVLDFSGLTGVANSDVDSGTVQVKLIDVNDPGGTKSIDIKKPRNCTIGATSVNNNITRVLVDGIEYANDTITFTEGNLRTVGVRFRNEGGYGDVSGIVSCEVQGELTHTY